MQTTNRFSVVIVRPGLPTTAIGPFLSEGIAEHVASNLVEVASVQAGVESHDETLAHLPLLPTTPDGLAEVIVTIPPSVDRLDLFTRLTGQLGSKARGILVDAYELRAAQLRAEVAGADVAG